MDAEIRQHIMRLQKSGIVDLLENLVSDYESTAEGLNAAILLNMGDAKELPCLAVVKSEVKEKRRVLDAFEAQLVYRRKKNDKG